MATPSQQTIALIIFAVVASSSIIIPTIAYNLYTVQVAAVLADWKYWLIRNNARLGVVLLVVFGSLIIGNGLAIVTA